MVAWEFCPWREVFVGVGAEAARWTDQKTACDLVAGGCHQVGWAPRAHALRARPQSAAVAIRSGTWPTAGGANEMFLGSRVDAALRTWQALTLLGLPRGHGVPTLR